MSSLNFCSVLCKVRQRPYLAELVFTGCLLSRVSGRATKHNCVIILSCPSAPLPLSQGAGPICTRSCSPSAPSESRTQALTDPARHTVGLAGSIPPRDYLGGSFIPLHWACCASLGTELALQQEARLSVRHARCPRTFVECSRTDSFSQHPTAPFRTRLH